jgi:RNA polymerase sigma-70 factor (sigma-E family)
MARHEPDADFTAYINARMLWLRRVAYLLCRDWDRADDLAQTAITRLYARWPKVRDSVENLDGYLRTILVNTYLTEQRSPWWRRLSLHQEHDSEPVFEFESDTGLDLQAALNALGPRQRAVIVLRYYCDLSVEQTAAELGCTPSTVKSQSSRGLATLRRVLASDSSLTTP